MQDTVLNSVVTGLYVLTAHNQGKINGATAAWVTPVSYDPLLVLVSLANVRYSHELVKESGYFGLNVLAEGQAETARHFGFKSGRETDKLEGYRFSTSERGIPILDDSMAYIECRVMDAYRAGEHTLFVGEVVSAKQMNESVKPLIFKQDDYF